jgi:(R)-2-hydroxyacyl-CoA dehydratese activating ATPase
MILNHKLRVDMTQIHALGIDVGSTTAKIVAVDADGKMVWHLLEDADPVIGNQVEQFLIQAQQVNGTIDDVPLVATGYGRKLVHQAARQITEITCHARGIYHEFGHGGTLVDIGGQDSKVIGISSSGKVIDFAMNDKCAAGTGRFLENTAARLRVPLQEIGQTALSVDNEESISSTCTVFAESEVISLLAHGVAVPSILRGLHRSLIKRIYAMIRTVGLTPPLMLSGGVVQNAAIRYMLEQETGEMVMLPQHPQLMGAHGAALFALDTEK